MICEMIDYKLLIHKRIILKYAVGSQGVDTKVIRFYKGLIPRSSGSTRG